MFIDTTFQSAIASGKIAGAHIFACDSKGHEYENLLGHRTLLSGEKKAHQADDIIYLASGTKLLTAIAALTCVEDGLLTLDRDISEYAPDLLPNQIITGEAITTPITLRMMLTHTSGLTYHFIDPRLAEYRKEHPPTKTRSPVEELLNYPLLYNPGSSWGYGTGLDWAGRVIEKVTGKSLGDRIRERVLHSEDAAFMPVTQEETRTRMVDLNPSDPLGLGKAVTGGSEINSEVEGDFGGQGLCTTAPLYLMVLKSLLANDGKMLEPETANLMFQNCIGDSTKAGLEEALKSPMGPFLRCGAPKDSPVGIALGGLLTLADVEGWFGANTLTWVGGMTFAWFVDRSKDLCGVCAIQSTMPADGELLNELKQTFRHDMYNIQKGWKSIS